jgi:transcriptional regulator with XRE-family HTH domain
MKTYKRWSELRHKNSPEELERIGREALEEYDRMGFAAVRKAREQTQVELAERLGINQASVSAIENNSDLLLSTLAKYVRALGGELQLQAVFPEATFNLAPPEMAMLAAAPARRVKTKRTSSGRPSARRPKAVAS